MNKVTQGCMVELQDTDSAEEHRPYVMVTAGERGLGRLTIGKKIGSWVHDKGHIYVVLRISEPGDGLKERQYQKIVYTFKGEHGTTRRAAVWGREL